MKLRLATVLLISQLASPPARSDESTRLAVRLDPAESRLSFTLEATLHTVEGSFRLVSGDCLVDTERRSIEGRLVIDAASGATGNKKRDAKMHAEVLESSRYPAIVFEPSSYSGELALEGSSRLELAGSLKLHGESRPLRVPVEVFLDGGRLRVKGEVSLPYVDWGLEDPSSFLLRVAESVDLSLELVGRLGAATATGGAGD